MHAHYHARPPKIFMLQKVEAMSTFWDVKICYARRWLDLLQAARSYHEKRARGPRA